MLYYRKMTDCKKCGRPLKAIGTARKNGKKSHNDWDNRELHKRCWLEERKYTETLNMLNFRDNLLNKILNKN